MTNALLVHICIACAGATLGTGLLAGAAQTGDREDGIHAPYMLLCLAASVVFFALAAFYDAGTLADATRALRWHVVGVVLVIPSYVWLCARIAHRTDIRSVFGIVLTGSAAILVMNAFAPASMHFDSLRVAPDSAPRELVFQARGGWRGALLHLWSLVPIGFGLLYSVDTLRRGGRLLGGVGLAAAALLLVANAAGTWTDFTGGRPMYLSAVPVLVALVVMFGLALGLSLRRQRLALLGRTEALRAANDQLRDEMARREKLEHRLAQTQRLEALGRMAAAVAHDFNNVLTVVAGRAELMRHGLAPTSPERGDIEAIDAAAAHGADLTRQLLAFARRQEMRPTAVDADRLIRDAQKLLASMAGGSGNLVLDLDARGRAIRADSTQFTQVLMNLIANARDAMPEGGVVTIRSYPAPNPAVTCACDGALVDEHVGIEVADTGSGIPAEVLPSVFEPFVTTKPPERGTGLGLAMVHGIVTQSGGHVAVESRPGAGTTVRTCWPCAGPAVTTGSPEAVETSTRG